MKRNFKIFAFSLSCLLLLGQFTGCSLKSGETKVEGQASNINVPDYLNLTGFPIVKKPVALTAMVSVHATQGENYSETFVWQEYEKMTGIKVDWLEIPSGNAGEKRQLAYASNDLPDFFYRMGISDNERINYGETGTFLKLNDLIDKYGPNFKKVMESKPEAKKSVPIYNGNIYSLATMNDGMAFQINPKMFINKKWLDNLGLKAPTTTDDLYVTLKTFKEKDANRNGNADELPWAGYAYRLQLINTIKGSFGLGNRGDTHDDVDVDPKTGKLRYQYTAPEFKDTLAYLGKLYQEGLIDKEIFSTNNVKAIAKVQKDIVGMINCANTALLGIGPGEDFIGMPGALKGPKGDQIYAATGSQMGARASFVITNANKYPEATMRWIDYFYSDEGVRFFYMGVEGKTYYKTPDGKYEFLPEIVKIPEGSTFDSVIAKYVPYNGGGSPTIVMTNYFKGGETQPTTMQAVNNLSPYAPKEIWGPFNYTIDEMEKYSVLNGDLDSYVGQMIQKFISGQESLSNWDTYVEQVKRLGLDEFMKLYETAYERYKKQ